MISHLLNIGYEVVRLVVGDLLWDIDCEVVGREFAVGRESAVG